MRTQTAFWNKPLQLLLARNAGSKSFVATFVSYNRHGLFGSSYGSLGLIVKDSPQNT